MKFLSLALFLVPIFSLVATASAVTIETVPVGNAGNAADPTIMFDGTSGYGSVAYEYRIGKYEVTNAQYTEFLNAKAATDPFGLYVSSSDVDDYHGMNGFLGGITRSGSDGFIFTQSSPAWATSRSIMLTWAMRCASPIG